jgi:uncharacterized transporter YbjL
VLFLAGVGTKAGDGFVHTLLGVKLLKLSIPEALGFVSGIQTQPACLAYASKKTASHAADAFYCRVVKG